MEENRLLRVDELLLLVNLLYLQGREAAPGLVDFEGQCLRALPLAVSEGTGLCMDEEDAGRLVHALRQNEVLQNLRIIAVCRQQERGGGVCACFYREESGEAIVAFGGTAREEWKDNFLGAAATEAADGVSTVWQLRARQWYASLVLPGSFVTVTGHSKGGNKAKYLALLEDSVDRCVSFDGQGFSDEFVDWYYARIALRQEIIENHSVDYDYVNLLLNDVGRRVYYEGCHPGRGGFLVNHCPNAFFDFQEDGSYVMRRAAAGQADEMRELDRFLNRYLRSMPERDKIDAAQWIGSFAQKKADGASGEDCLRQLLQDQYLDAAAYFAAYMVRYGQQYPEFAAAVAALAKKYGMEDLLNLPAAVKQLLEWKYFPMLAAGSAAVSGVLPEPLSRLLFAYLKTLPDIRLPRELLPQLAQLACKTAVQLREPAPAAGNGEDLLPAGMLTP